jgi:hypothetical protein
MKTSVWAVLFFGTLLVGDAADTNTYSNPTLGISVTKPKDWHFATLEEHRENLGRATFKDEDFKKMVQKYSTTPVVVMMKYREPYDDVNPSFKINIKPLGNLPANKPTAILSLLVPTFEKNFKDFEMIVGPKEINVGKENAAYMKVNYNMEVEEVGKFPVCSELWIITRGTHFYMLGAGTRQDEKTGKREEIQKILESIRFE